MDLELASMHRTSREDLAIKMQWNNMEYVAEAELRKGAEIFVGRVAPQADLARVLPGGHMQFLIPTGSRGSIHILQRHST